SGKGRPSIPASVMASILVLQTLHDLPDRETAEAARCDLRWKVSTGMALDHPRVRYLNDKKKPDQWRAT
ncbi:MAG: transposase, partial [Mycobacteriaceae bacterium]|nr:transposase [Mycobacteriaceae bacterium]